MSNYKKIEAMLYNYNKTKAEIKNLDIEINYMQSNFEGISGLNLTEKTGKTYKITSSVENEVINKDKKVKELEYIRSLKVREINKIDNAIDSLTDREKLLVKYRYFDRIGNLATANKLELTEQRVSELKKDIIKNIESIIIF